jgi:hypothetical protein
MYRYISLFLFVLLLSVNVYADGDGGSELVDVDIQDGPYIVCEEGGGSE